MLPDSGAAGSSRGNAGRASISGVITGVISGVCAASAFGIAGSRAAG
ncbi:MULTISPECIES: hypothetical protein [unclassified Amycolatopsis]|nr:MULTISPECIES: hypothetical protein [unclassified Amycolatopsis]MDS0140711.1 hypothetical protein [Amycolatopsis sp. 505]MDS0149647.1 hypothetical protein [Amycolatopsis sp. CM201R]